MTNEEIARRLRASPGLVKRLKSHAAEVAAILERRADLLASLDRAAVLLEEREREAERKAEITFWRIERDDDKTELGIWPGANPEAAIVAMIANLEDGQGGQEHVTATAVEDLDRIVLSWEGEGGDLEFQIAHVVWSGGGRVVHRGEYESEVEDFGPVAVALVETPTGDDVALRCQAAGRWICCTGEPLEFHDLTPAPRGEQLERWLIALSGD